MNWYGRSLYRYRLLQHKPVQLRKKTEAAAILFFRTNVRPIFLQFAPSHPHCTCLRPVDRILRSPLRLLNVFMPDQNSAATSSRPTPVVDLKTPWLAALLSWAVPGLGQIYQGRYFKGVLFMVCILGMFLFGIQLGEGRPVYVNYYIVSDGQMLEKRNYGYLSQMLVGAAAMPALVQSNRFKSDDNSWVLDAPVEAPFSGTIYNGRGPDDAMEVDGAISLVPEPGPFGATLTGRLVGQLKESGERIDLELVPYSPELDLPPVGLKISANPDREVRMRIREVIAGPAELGDNLKGTIPRPATDWFQVPLQDQELQDMNARLGKRWELAMVLTWIAGLLNILAIWDAFEGPAYGVRPIERKPEPEGDSAGKKTS